jgi:TolB-like protein/Tfp pilus assembly protein PilF
VLKLSAGRILFASLGTFGILLLACTLSTCMREGMAVENPSVAVIPSSGSMCDPELEYISAGMHDAIISELGNVNSLLVKSKAATNKYLDSKLPGQQIGNELGANVIVKHSIVCTDEGMRLFVQLIQLIPEEKEIWSNTYDLDLSNSLTIYRDITKQITKNIKADITPQEKTYLNTARPVNSELYKKYLQGVFYMNKLTPEGAKQGIQYLNEAIAIDPKDPLPYLGLALGYSNAGHVSDAGPDAPRLAREYALKALELDSTLAEAYTVLATQYLYGDWDFPATENALKRSIALNPNIASLHYTLGWYLLLKGKQDEAEKEMKLSVEIEPLDPFCSGYLAWFYLWRGKLEDAITMSHRALELNPNDPMALYVLGSAYAEKGMYDQAIETHKKGIAIEPLYTCGLGVTYARAGRKREALEVAAEMEKANSAWYIWGIAAIYAELGDKDKTIQWIRASYDQHDQFFPWTGISPKYKFLTSDPRFREIIGRVKLPS